MHSINVVTLPPDAVVGLERTLYQVSEDVGVVEVCAIIYHPNVTCPIEFPFTVNLTTNGSAGNTHYMTSLHKCSVTPQGALLIPLCMGVDQCQNC